MRVADDSDQPMSGVRVSFEVVAGGGAADPAAAATDADGEASTRWVLGTDADSHTLVAGIDGSEVEVSSTSAGKSVCLRNPVVGAALAASMSRADCSEVTASGLAGLTELVVGGGRQQDAGPNVPVLYKLESADLMGLAGLSLLGLAYNSLTALPDDLFRGTPRLRNLSLSYNFLPELPAGVFDGLTELGTLDLGHNILSELPAGIFDQLSDLLYLFLGRNRLSSLPDGVFENLENLEYLSLPANQLSTLPEGQFRGLSNLSTLRLGSNPMPALPDGVFDGLSRLEELYLEGNGLAEVSSGAFRGAPNIRKLFLVQNQLTALPADLFAEFSSLRELNLIANRLESLPDGIFENTGELDVLWLDSNPGSPFALAVELERTDNQNPLAPGPAEVVARLPLGAPYPIRISLAAPGGALSADSVLIEGGRTSSTAVTATNSPGSSLAIAATVPDVPATFCYGVPCYTGIETRAGPPLVLANPESANLNVEHAHLTQAVQDLDGRVPLVAGRRALLRVFATSDSANAFRPAARATFYRSGAAIRTVALEPPPAGVPAGVDQGSLGNSFNAVIPGDALRPGVEMVVELDPDGDLPLAPGSARRFPAQGRLSVDVRQPPAFDLTIVPVQWAWGVNAGVNARVLEYARGLDAAGAEEMRYARALLPIAQANVTVREPYFTWADTTTAGGPGLLGEIDLLRHLDGAGGGQYYHGIFGSPRTVRAGGFWNFIGVATIGGRSALTMSHWENGAANHLASQTIAHEIGHNMTLRHAPCGEPDNVDPGFPYANASTGVWGYDFGVPGRRAGRLLDPRASFDMMSYCPPHWISDYNFTRAMTYLEDAGNGQAATAGFGDAAGGSREVLLLWGGIRDGHLRVEPAFVWEAPVKLPRSPGAYRLEGLDAAGRALFSLAFSPDEIDHGGRSFLFAIPYDQAWTTALDRIVLSGREGSKEVDVSASRKLAIFSDPATGRIRGIARDWQGDLPPEARSLSRTLVRSGLPEPPR